MDEERLAAAGFTVEAAEGGYRIKGPSMLAFDFVPATGGVLDLLPSRSSLHRQISGILGAG